MELTLSEATRKLLGSPGSPSELSPWVTLTVPCPLQESEGGVRVLGSGCTAPAEWREENLSVLCTSSVCLLCCECIVRIDIRIHSKTALIIPIVDSTLHCSSVGIKGDYVAPLVRHSSGPDPHITPMSVRARGSPGGHMTYDMQHWNSGEINTNRTTTIKTWGFTESPLAASDFVLPSSQLCNTNVWALLCIHFRAQHNIWQNKTKLSQQYFFLWWLSEWLGNMRTVVHLTNGLEDHRVSDTEGCVSGSEQNRSPPLQKLPEVRCGISRGYGPGPQGENILKGGRCWQGVRNCCRNVEGKARAGLGSQ